MADSIAQVRQCVDLLRSWGHRVELVPGWENRGKGSMTTRGRIEHHTAGGSANTASLRVVTFGRAGLRNSLSRWYVARDGTIYLVARRLSWHAGSGVKGSNSTLSGTEGEHSGRTSESWGAQLDAMEAISRAEIEVFGIRPDDVWEHREHAPGRKVDRINIDGSAWRHRLAQQQEGFLMALSEREQQQLLDKVLKTNTALGALVPQFETMARQIEATEDKARKTNHAVGDLHAFVQDLADGTPPEEAARQMIQRIQRRNER